jgi:hypothetical protein
MIREDGRSHLDRELKVTVNGIDGARSKDSRNEEITVHSYLDRLRSGFGPYMDRLSKFIDATFLSLDAGSSGDSQFPPRGMAFD